MLCGREMQLKVLTYAVDRNLTLSKPSRRHFEIFFLVFPENRIYYFMQIVSFVKANFLGKVRKISLSSAESVKRVVNVDLLDNLPLPTNSHLLICLSE